MAKKDAKRKNRRSSPSSEEELAEFLDKAAEQEEFIARQSWRNSA